MSALKTVAFSLFSSFAWRTLPVSGPTFRVVWDYTNDVPLFLSSGTTPMMSDVRVERSAESSMDRSIDHNVY
jgi:hypothetical protein